MSINGDSKEHETEIESMSNEVLKRLGVIINLLEVIANVEINTALEDLSDGPTN